MTSGVYQVFNKVSGDTFIGGSMNIEIYLNSAFKVLLSGDRYSCFNGNLRQAWRLHGGSSFNWRIVEKTKAFKWVVAERTFYWRRVLQPTYNDGDYPLFVSGIYRIFNITAGYSYIGQSTDIYLRWKKHRSGLETNNHPNKFLQQSWNKHGASNFRFEILEACLPDKTILTLLERSWIARTPRVFNVR